MNDKLNEETARSLIWRCRIEYYYKILAWEEYDLNETITMSNKKKISQRNQRNIHTIAFYFLSSLGVITRNDEMAPDFREMFKNATLSLSKRNKETEPGDLGIPEALVLSLLGFCQQITGHGLPRNLMEVGAVVAEKFYETFHPDEYDAATKLFITDNHAGIHEA